MRKYLLSLVLLVVAWPTDASSHAADTASLDLRRKELNQLLAEEWEYELREFPENATAIGDYRYNDRWSDYSVAHVQQQRVDFQNWLSRFDAIDTTGFTEQEKLNQVLMIRNLKMEIEGIDLKTFEMPIDQFFGAHLWIAQFVSFAPFNTTKQYEDYLARLRREPALIVDLRENRLTHELRYSQGLGWGQIPIKNMLVRQNGIEILNEATIASVCAPEVVTPRFQTIWKQECKQRTLNLPTIKQILCVLPQVVRLSSVSGT